VSRDFSPFVAGFALSGQHGAPRRVLSFCHLTQEIIQVLNVLGNFSKKLAILLDVFLLEVGISLELRTVLGDGTPETWIVTIAIRVRPVTQHSWRSVNA